MLMQYYFCILFYKTVEKFQCEIKLILHVERAHKHFLYITKKERGTYMSHRKTKWKKVQGWKGGVFERTLEHISQNNKKVFCLKFGFWVVVV